MSCLPSRCSFANPAVGYTQAGAGETVLLLHGSASSAVMWRPVSAVLQQLYQVIAPDLIGYGSSAPWQGGADFSLEDELRAIKPLLPCCGGPFHLIGYSYGGVVALSLALANPMPVQTITLIEPVFFSALRYAAADASYGRFEEEGRRFRQNLDAGYPATAMRDFINFWCGKDAWDQRLSGGARSAMIGAVQKVALDWQAAFAFDPGPERLERLAGRTAMLRGNQSPEAMQQLVESLHTLMPGSVRSIVQGADHLLPLTHANAVANLILDHLHSDAERRLH
jgi:pimeloyl-ACP methyl ester carboxylesterase